MRNNEEMGFKEADKYDGRKKTLLDKDKLPFKLILFIFLKRRQIGTGMTKSVLRSNESYKEGQLGAFLLLFHNTTK